MKIISKKKYKMFTDSLKELLIKEFGLKPIDTLNDYLGFEIQTDAGELILTIPLEQSYHYTIFGRFKDINKAKSLYDCNPYSGKYNIYIDGLHSIDEAKEFFKSYLKPKF
jgi:hypothetical protein